MGPGGPLVRFAYFFFPLLSLSRAEAELRRSSPVTGGSSRGPEGGDGSATPGRSSRWAPGWWGRRELPAASFAAEEASVAEWFWGECGSRSKSSRGLGSWKEGGVLGEEKWEGEALVALEELGPWRRSLLPEVGKMTSPGRLAAPRGPRGWLKSRLRARKVSGRPFIARRGRFRGGG